MKRSEQHTKPAWLQQAVDELQQPVTPSVAGQLRAARRTALAQERNQERNKRPWLRNIGLPVWGGAAVAGLGALAVVTLFFVQPEPDALQPSLQAQADSSKAVGGNVLLEDLPIMAAQDDLQFYQDLELLQWLAEEGELDAQG